MTVGTFNQPNNTTQDPTTYKGSIDASISVLVNVAGQFAPHQQASANMTVLVDAGTVLNGTTLTTKAQQVTGVITAPTNGTQRIDRVVVSTSTGNVSVITGTQSNSPVAPAFITGNMPIAQVLLLASSTMILNSMITDERQFDNNSVLTATNVSGGTANVTTFTGNGLMDISASAGGQIKFPAAQNASSDANTLDDYEEGTWTPTLQFGGANVGIAYNTQVGYYTKIGRLVALSWSITLSSKGNSTGNASIAGQPFSPTGFSSFGSVFWNTLATTWVNVATLGDSPLLLIGATAATASLGGVQLTNAAFANSTNIYGYLTFP